MKALLDLVSKVSRSAAPSVTNPSTASGAVPVPTFKTEEYLRTFAGEPEEDPEVFISEVENYLAEVEDYLAEVGQITSRHQVLVAHKQLRGGAARRNKYYQASDACIEDLWRRLRADFGTHHNFADLMAKFTGTTYNRRDPLDLFIEKQRRLYKRLFPTSPESRLVRELVKQMPAHVRPMLAVGKYEDVADFRRVAEEVMGFAPEDNKTKTRPSENWWRASHCRPP